MKLSFEEVYKTVVVSTCHISWVAGEVLEAASLSNNLPWWIIATNYGYIIKFSSAKNNGVKEFTIDNCDDSLNTLCQQLLANGFNAVEIDRDGMEVEGLIAYEW